MRLFAILKLLAGRVKFGDGWLQVGDILIQWGLTTITSAPGGGSGGIDGGRTTVYFPKAFSVSGQVHMFYSNNYATYLASVSSQALTHTYVTIVFSGTRELTTEVTVPWLAIGKA